VTAAATGSPRLNPEIAVVIPTRGRETRLAFALEALAAQTVACERFEVVVVRDGDAEPPLAGAPPGLRLRELTRPGVAGPTAKRNLGCGRPRRRWSRSPTTTAARSRTGSGR